MFKNKKKHFFNFETIKEDDKIENNKEVDLNDDLDFSVSDINSTDPIETKKETIEEENKIAETIEEKLSDNDKEALKEDKREETSINEDESISKEEVNINKDESEVEEVEEVESLDVDNVDKHKKLNDFKSKISGTFNWFLDSLKETLKKKWIIIDKRLIAFHINESLRSIILLILAIIWLIQAFDTYNAIDKLPLIKKHYVLKKEIKIEDAKIKENKKAEYLADILKFWVVTENGRYPEGWYLNAFKTIFPDNISELQLLTFLEWWWSEFTDYKWRKIRVDHWLIKTFEQDNNVDDNWYLKWYKYHIVLEWEPSKVDNVLYNLRYSNKIPKYFSSIDKKYSSKSWLINVDIKVLFYLSK